MRDVIFPYSIFRGGLRMSLSAVHLDAEPVSSEILLPDSRMVNLFEVSSLTWSRVTFQIEVVADGKRLEEFEQRHGRASLTMVAMCRLTNNRQTIP